MMNSPPERQGKSSYSNPFSVPGKKNPDSNVRLYPKLDVQDNLTRIIHGKEPGASSLDPGRFEGSPSAYSAVNEQIANRLLAKNLEPMKLLQVKPEIQGVGLEAPQKYVPHLNLSKP
jgi:hypothetical protein